MPPLLDAPNPDPIVFSNGQLVWTAPSGDVLCLNGGQGPLIPPCYPPEAYVAQQVQVDNCASFTTQGWSRVPVA